MGDGGQDARRASWRYGPRRRHRTRPREDQMRPMSVASAFRRKISAFVFLALLIPLPPKGGSYGNLEGAGPLFVESAASTGLTFTHVNGASGEYYIAEQMGAGVALF